MAGCPFGENCHFLHFVPGGYKAVAQMKNLGPAPASKIPAMPVPIQNGSAPTAVKTKLCNKFNSAEGCKFNEKCHFAHGERELGRPITQSQSQSQSHEDPRAIGGVPSHLPAQGLASFGASATAKISVDASLAGAIIGKGGVNSKQICRQTGAKLSIRDHETDPGLRNIELEGTFEQIKQASTMVREVIVSIGAGSGSGSGSGAAPGKTFGTPGQGGNLKTKLCENFSKGSCTFGDRCHFAHGAAELRKAGI